MSPQASNSAALLRMLEPAVRPVPGGAAAPKSAPFEQQSFQSLLSNVQDSDASQNASGTAQSGLGAPSHNHLQDLTGHARIENESLRNLIAKQHNSASPREADHPME